MYKIYTYIYTLKNLIKMLLNNKMAKTLKVPYYANFLRFNLSLMCPQNVSVKFQLKIPHRSFIIACQICPYLGVSKNTPFLCVSL